MWLRQIIAINSSHETICFGVARRNAQRVVPFDFSLEYLPNSQLLISLSPDMLITET